MKWLPGKTRDKRWLTRREEQSPFQSLQREINSLFDDFFEGFSLTPFEKENRFGSFVPCVDMRENEKEIHVSAELPGMDEKDVEVSLSKGALSIKGEKRTETKKEDKDYHYIERSSGSFYREIGLPENIDCDKAEASFKKGVLEIKIPKIPVAGDDVKKIPVKSSE